MPESTLWARLLGDTVADGSWHTLKVEGEARLGVQLAPQRRPVRTAPGRPRSGARRRSTVGNMSYDSLAESVRLLDGQVPPADTARLSRRVRFLPIAFDRCDDIAATLFLRRGVSGTPTLDLHTLERRGQAWSLLGGGSGDADESELRRPPLADAATVLVRGDGAGTARTADRLFPWPSRWVWCEQLLAATGVVALRVEDRVLPVAAHGLAVVVWPSSRTPRVTALDRDGRLLGELRLDRRRR
ncbi:MAG TPA: hypothetical protein VNA12_08340 [Mycobacteriales bacterium]|nr:hypothetical protein [Mycobacteriales bacterium]